MESLLHGFTVVPQTQLMGCALLLYPHAPGCQWWDPFLLAPTAAAIVTSRKTCHLAEGNLHLPSSVSVMQPGYLPDFLTDFYKIPPVPAGKRIGLTALSRGNSQKRIHFRMIQTPFTTSSKQLFTNYSIGSHMSGCLIRRKCLYCVFHTEINREKMLIKWLLGSQNMLSFAKRCYCHTKRSWGKNSWLTSASVCICLHLPWLK